MAPLNLKRVTPQYVGSALVESCSSAFVRAAEANHVLLVDFRDAVQACCPAHEQGNWPTALPHFGGLDGINPVSRQFSESQSLRASLGDCRNLTCQNLSGLIACRRVVRRYKAWCPLCLHESLAEGHVVYEHLLWRLQPCTCCLVHGVGLETICPRCGSDRLNLLSATSRVGCCTKCGEWLGRDAAGREATDAEIRRATTLGAFLRNLPALATQQPDGADIIRRIRSHRFNGGTRAFASALSRDTTQLYGWTDGVSLPSLEDWAEMCDTLSISPTCLLFELPPVDSGAKRVRARLSHDLEEIRQSALTALTMDDRPSLWIAVGRDAVRYQLARRHFPEIYDLIEVKKREFDEQRANLCARAIDAAIASPVTVSNADVARALNVDTQVMRRAVPAETAVLAVDFSKKRSADTRKRIERRLMDVRRAMGRLGEAGTPLTITNVVEELGMPRYSRPDGELLELIREEWHRRGLSEGGPPRRRRPPK
jgi:hypothetical protein